MTLWAYNVPQAEMEQVLAENTATNDGTEGTNITVGGKYQVGAPAAEKISVDLVWEAMDFT